MIGRSCLDCGGEIQPDSKSLYCSAICMVRYEEPHQIDVARMGIEAARATLDGTWPPKVFEEPERCEPGTGWMYCGHAPGLTVCRCACTCTDQRHCERPNGTAA